MGFGTPSFDSQGAWGLNVSLNGYKTKSGNLKDFPSLPMLVDLGLIQANICSLEGISRFGALKRLELAYLSKLQWLDELAQLPLEVLDCQNCKKLQRHEVVRELNSLRVLMFNDCGEIPTLSFLNEMPNLEEFRFVNTNIIDGSLRPLLRLKWVGFLPKKHSHTPEQLDAILRPKGGSAISRIQGPQGKDVGET